MPVPPHRKKSFIDSSENLSDDAKKNIITHNLKRSTVWDRVRVESEFTSPEKNNSSAVNVRKASLASTYSIDSSSDSNKTFVVQGEKKEGKNNGTISNVEINSSPEFSPTKANETICEVDVHEFIKFDTKSNSSTQSAKVFVLNETSDSKKAADSASSKTSSKPPVPLPRKSISISASNKSQSPKKSSVEDESHVIEIENLPLKSFKESSISKWISDSNSESITHDDNEKDSLIERKPKPRRKKKRKSSPSNQDDSIELRTLKTQPTEIQINQTSEFSKDDVDDLDKEQKMQEQCVLGVLIHGCDGLAPDLFVCHPIVRVFMVDQDSGEFIKKSDSSRSSSVQYDLAQFIVPTMTQPYDFYQRKSVVPKWEELLVFSESPDYLLKPSTLFLFEIIDFLSFSMADSQYAQFGTESAWHHVAWAFLKIINENSFSNLGKKLRLQLFKPKQKNVSPSKSKIPHLFWWYKSHPKKIYPSTLHVTIKSLSLTEQNSSVPVVPPARGKGSLESLGSLNFLHSESEDIDGYLRVNFTDKELPSVKWDRIVGQSCKLPNSKLLSLNVGGHGALSVKFSWSGLLLASASSGHIYIHMIPQGFLFCRLPGHQGLVYSLQWTTDDSLLLSASADCTVCIWHILETKKPGLLQILPHPSYIYSAIFINKYIVASGCCDGVIRLWVRTKKLVSYELSQELCVHSGYVNSLSYCNGLLYSADSQGVILVWISEDDRWVLSREYNLSELVGVNINNILMHPAGKRMIIHSRDSQLRMMDIATGAIIQWFQGCLNERLQTGSCLSQCGGILFAWSEEGILCSWITDTGEQLGIYSGDIFPPGCGCVDYHPYDHIAAFSVHSATNSSPLIVAQYKREVVNNNVGLSLMKINQNVDPKPMAAPRHFEWEKLMEQMQQQSAAKSRIDSSSKKNENDSIELKTINVPKRRMKSSKRSLLAKSVSILSGSESNLFEDASVKNEEKKKVKKSRNKTSKNKADSINSFSYKNSAAYDNLSFEINQSDEGLSNQNECQILGSLPRTYIDDPRLVDIINRIDKVLASSNQ